MTETKNADDKRLKDLRIIGQDKVTGKRVWTLENPNKDSIRYILKKYFG